VAKAPEPVSTTLRRSIALACLATALTACSTVRPQTCAPGLQAAVQEFIYFGAEKPGGVVTPEDWNRFLGEIVTPRFPAGFTTWQAAGQWRSASGTIVREPSYVLSVVHPAGAAHESSIREVVDAYRVAHAQEAVLRVRSPVCMAL
jgi:hypothetical protein